MARANDSANQTVVTSHYFPCSCGNTRKVRISTKNNLGSMKPKPCPMCNERSVSELWSNLLWAEHWAMRTKRTRGNKIDNAINAAFESCERAEKKAILISSHNAPKKVAVSLTSAGFDPGLPQMPAMPRIRLAEDMPPVNTVARTVARTILCKANGRLMSEALCLACHIHPCVEAQA
jgi:hypothetical protein